MIRRSYADLCAAVQFLTRLPVPSYAFDDGTMGRATAWFPLVGLLVGALAAALAFALRSHLPPLMAASLLVLLLILLTGGLHDDALGDAADGFGGGRTPERILDIFKDSRVGSFGAIAICLSLVMRIVLLSALPQERFAVWLIAAQVLSRWTALPLGLALPAARPHTGQGARVAGQVSSASFVLGTAIALAIVLPLMRASSWRPAMAAVVVMLLSGAYYWRRLRGVTGDCFGATQQLTEIAIYLCGVWR